MLALIIVPMVEVFIILKVGQTIGGWPTFALLVLWSGLGAWIVKRESGRAFSSLRQAFGSGRMPSRELSDAALVLVGGTLLLAPGFLTDALGLFFLLPFTRPVTRRLLEKAVAAKLFGTARMTTFAPGAFGNASLRAQRAGSSRPYPTSESFASTARRHSRPNATEEVVEGEIID